MTGAHSFLTEWVVDTRLRKVVIRNDCSRGTKLLFTLFQLWEPLQESRYPIKQTKTKIKFIFDLLRILMNFPITFLKLILPLFFEIPVILDSLWILMVAISCVSGCTTLVVNNRSALEVLVILLHVTVPLGI